MSGLPRIHAVTDDRVVAAAGIVRRAAAMADAIGPDLAVQLRSRALGGAALLGLARELASVLAPRGSWLIVNDRADVARAGGAAAVVSGRGGLSVEDIRKAAPGLLAIRSVHDRDEAQRAAAEGADALIAGHVFETPTHAGEPPRGVEVVRQAAATGRPVIAIGGLTSRRIAQVLEAGAVAIAAIRALWDAPDPGAASRELLAQFDPPGTVGLIINGEPHRVRRGSLLDVLAALGLDPRAVVVEHNRRIVRRDALAATTVAEGDTVELVHFVGGG
ncbi:MAG TPA: sulfur carrier protein ThiS [Gemmatimonadales bacterium]|nr:sulfur carrier protein ThiS [Gemmatimonadales bacterium]